MQGFAFCNELYGSLPLRLQLERIAAAGYDGVELDARCLPGLDLEATADYCRQIGLVGVGLHWLLAGVEGLHLTHPSPDVRQRTLNHLRGLIRSCSRLGGRVMVLGGGKKRSPLEGVTRSQALDYAEGLLRALGDNLVASGVRIGVEPLAPEGDSLINSAAAAAEMVDRIGCPNIGLVLDARAMEAESEPRERLITAFADYLVHVHVNDANGSGPGMGSTDLGPMLRALKMASYPGWVSVEAFDPAPDPHTVAIRSLEYLRGRWQDAQ